MVNRLLFLVFGILVGYGMREAIDESEPVKVINPAPAMAYSIQRFHAAYTSCLERMEKLEEENTSMHFALALSKNCPLIEGY